MTHPISGASWTTISTGNGNGNDDVRINKASGADGLKGLYEVSINGKVQLMTKEQLEHTHFNLQGGNDTLVVDPKVDANISADGGDGNDVMLGGAGNDQFTGGAGKDILMGRGGRDWLDGGKDHDRDVIEGGADDDVVVARQEDRVVTDRETGVTGQDLVVDGDAQDRMQDAVRNR
jgi:Ca2+-binding RTX toxin-like protein